MWGTGHVARALLPCIGEPFRTRRGRLATLSNLAPGGLAGSIPLEEWFGRMADYVILESWECEGWSCLFGMSTDTPLFSQFLTRCASDSKHLSSRRHGREKKDGAYVYSTNRSCRIGSRRMHTFAYVLAQQRFFKLCCSSSVGRQVLVTAPG